MKRRIGVSLLLAAALAACGSQDRPEADGTAAVDRAVDAGDTTSAAAADPHAGHVVAPAAAAAPADPHAGHAAAQPARPGQAADLHAGHAAAQPARPGQAADLHAGHATPAAAPAAQEQAGHGEPAHGGAGAAGLAELMSALVLDPAVRQRIEQDTALRAMWSDTTVRRHITTAPAAGFDITQIIKLVQLLMEDPAVRARIQADPVLRELWSDAAIRQQIQRGGHH